MYYCGIQARISQFVLSEANRNRKAMQLQQLERYVDLVHVKIKIRSCFFLGFPPKKRMKVRLKTQNILASTRRIFIVVVIHRMPSGGDKIEIFDIVYEK